MQQIIHGALTCTLKIIIQKHISIVSPCKALAIFKDNFSILLISMHKAGEICKAFQKMQKSGNMMNVLTELKLMKTFQW